MNTTKMDIKHPELKKTITILLLSLGMSFFGYLYEQIDFIPNYFNYDKQMEISLHWSKFHHLTNPAYYHILPALIAILCIIIIWRRKNVFNKSQHKTLVLISILIFIINLLTALAVTQINDKLYFGQDINNETDLQKMAIQWSVLNILRLILIFVCGRELLIKFRDVFIETELEY